MSAEKRAEFFSKIDMGLCKTFALAFGGAAMIVGENAVVAAQSAELAYTQAKDALKIGTLIVGSNS